MGFIILIPIGFVIIVIVEALMFWWLGWRRKFPACLRDAIWINSFTYGLSLWDSLDRVSVATNIMLALRHFNIPNRPPITILAFSGKILGTLLFLIIIESLILMLLREQNSRLKAVKDVIAVNIISSIVLGIMFIFLWYLYIARAFWFLDKLS